MGDFIVFAIIAIVAFGLVYWYYKKNRKPESEIEKEKENPAMAELSTKLARKEAQGEVQGNDFEVFIISESEYKSKTEEEIDKWIRSRFDDKTGTYPPFEFSGRGLIEFPYITPEKTIDVFFLVVDKTSKPVIDWKPEDEIVKPIPPKPEEPELTPDNPIRYKVVNGLVIEFEFLHNPDFDYYLIQRISGGGGAWRNVSDSVEKTYNERGNQIFRELNPTELDGSWYRVEGQKYGGAYGDREEIYRIQVEAPQGIPEKDWSMDVRDLPVDSYPENYTVYEIELPDTDEDVTAEIQSQIDRVPDGKKGGYSIARFVNTDREFFADGNLKVNHRGKNGIIHLVGRRNLIVEAPDDERFTFTFDKPAIPRKYGGHSGRSAMKVRQSHNVWVRKINIIGSNTIPARLIGSTKELTPDWWWMNYYTRDDGSIRFPVASWWLLEHEQELIGDREVPDYDSKEDIHYLNFLQQDVQVGRWVPRGVPSTGHTDAPPFIVEWEFEHGIEFSHFNTNVRVSNCYITGTHGCGVYTSHTSGSLVDYVISDKTGRMGFSYANDAKDFKLYRSKALAAGRSPLDFEPDGSGLRMLPYTKGMAVNEFWLEENGLTMADIKEGDMVERIHVGQIDGGEVTECEIHGRWASGGTGWVDNINVHHNKLYGPILFLGSPNIRRRRNLNISDNEFVGYVGQLKITDVENVNFDRNILTVSDDDKEFVKLDNCSGEISIKGNKYPEPHRIRLLKTSRNSVIEIEGNTPKAENGMVNRRLDFWEPEIEIEYKEEEA